MLGSRFEFCLSSGYLAQYGPTCFLRHYVHVILKSIFFKYGFRGSGEILLPNTVLVRDSISGIILKSIEV